MGLNLSLQRLQARFDRLPIESQLRQARVLERACVTLLVREVEKQRSGESAVRQCLEELHD